MTTSLYLKTPRVAHILPFFHHPPIFALVPVVPHLFLVFFRLQYCLLPISRLLRGDGQYPLSSGNLATISRKIEKEVNRKIEKEVKRKFIC